MALAVHAFVHPREPRGCRKKNDTGEGGFHVSGSFLPGCDLARSTQSGVHARWNCGTSPIIPPALKRAHGRCERITAVKSFISFFSSSSMSTFQGGMLLRYGLLRGPVYMPPSGPLKSPPPGPAYKPPPGPVYMPPPGPV